MQETDPTSVISCDKARAAIREFLRGDMPMARANELRAHRKVCEACDTEYRELVQGVAAISSGARATAESYSPSTTVRRAEGSEDAAAAQGQSGHDGQGSDDDESSSPAATRPRRSLLAPNSNGRFRLPRLFLPLALVVAFVAITMQAGAPKVALIATGGEVWKGTRPVEDTAAVAVSRFETCVTGSNGHARLELGANCIVLDPVSSCLVDRLDVLSIRMFEGRARIEGDARVLLPIGAIETKGGAATVTFDDTGVSIANESGSVLYTDGAGRKSLAPSESLRIETPAPTPDDDARSTDAATDAAAND